MAMETIGRTVELAGSCLALIGAIITGWGFVHAYNRITGRRSRPKLGVNARAGSRLRRQHTWQENSAGSHTTAQLAPDGVMGNEARVPPRIALAGPGPTVL